MTTMAQQGLGIVGFVQRFQDLQQHRDSNEHLIRDLLLYCDRVENSLRLQNTKLLDELQLCKLDLCDATNSRRDLQQRLQTCEARSEWVVKENEELKSRNSYILVVIDGDSLIFRQRWVQQGVEGGKRAAEALRCAIAEHCDNRSGDVDIVAKVVADLGGLARSLGCEGRQDVLADLRDFAAGFSQARASFDFIDVGREKDAARSKLKDLTRWHLRNHNCRHVLLGISRDAEYAPFLDQMLEDENTRQCIAVLEGAPTAKEIVATRVHVLDIGKDLFRTEEPFPTRQPAPAWSAWSGGSQGAASPTTSVDSSSAPAAGTTMSYAHAISSGSPPPQLGIPVPAKSHAAAASRPKIQYQQIPPQQPHWNPGPRGLDEPIVVSTQALECIKKRKDKDKLCNNHFLRGPCTKGDACHFFHNYKPSADEINAISVLARQNPCTNGQDCMLDDCIYGHHCPSIKDGMCCHPFCKFAEDAHPPGTRFKNVHIRAN